MSAKRRPVRRPDVSTALSALDEALALLRAIEYGELLAAAPAAADERARHATGVSLMALLEKRLRSAHAQLREGGADAGLGTPDAQLARTA